EHGIVPRAAWEPRLPFEKNPHADRMLVMLQERIAQYHIDLAAGGVNRKQLLAAAKQDTKDILDFYTGPVPSSFTYEGVKYNSPKDFAEKAELNLGTKIVRVSATDDKIPDKLMKKAPKDGG